MHSWILNIFNNIVMGVKTYNHAIINENLSYQYRQSFKGDQIIS